MSHKINYFKLATEPGGGWKGLADKYKAFLPDKLVGPVVEIGVDWGFSLFTLAHDWPDYRVTGVDEYKGYFGRDSCGYLHVQKWLPYFPNAYLRIMSSLAAAPLFADGSLGLVHIDAGHDYASVKSDIVAWLPKLAKGGIALFHDIEECPDVARAFNEILGRKATISGSCGLGIWYND